MIMRVDERSTPPLNDSQDTHSKCGSSSGKRCSRVRNSIFVNLSYSMCKPPVIPHPYTSFNINDPHFQSRSELRYNVCKCLNSITKKMLHFYNIFKQVALNVAIKIMKNQRKKKI